MYNFDTAVIIESIPNLIDGVKMTLFISVISSICAFIIGLIIVFSRTMGLKYLKFFAVCYVEIIRNTPLLVQLYIMYKALPSLGIMLSPISCGILSLSLYAGAFISEVLRSGIHSVANEQFESSTSLGLSKFQAFTLIIFPQAIRIVIPPLSSQFINIIKNSSLVSFIAVTDLFYRIYKGAVDDFRFVEFFLAGAFIYMMLTGVIALFSNILENVFRLRGRTAKI